MPNDYIFTWKSDIWPYEKLRALVDDFEAGEKVTQPWRCSAHKKIKVGDSAYLLKQGNHPKGIFAVGTITGPAVKNSKAAQGENPWQVPITFRALVDPTEKLFVSETQLLAMPVPAHRWSPYSSGVRLESAAARAIDALIDTSTLFLPSESASNDAFEASNIKDAREKINRAIVLRRGQRAFRESLLAAYDRRCVITGCDIEDLLEAAHIVPYKGEQTNHIQNGLLLRSDIHTLYDCGLIAIDPEKMTVVISSRLSKSSYNKLADKKIRSPKGSADRPSSEALAIHRRTTRL
jgi:hypothetical protein